MRFFGFLSSILFVTSLISCQSSDQKAVTLRGSGDAKRATGPAVATFTSAADSSAQVRLQLYADSTFQLAVSSPEGSAAYDMQGKLAITEDHYQLSFPDTVAQLNELITPVHPDASVVVYPDGSVALDRALTQFYVRGILVTYDTLTEKRE